MRHLAFQPVAVPLWVFVILCGCGGPAPAVSAALQDESRDPPSQGQPSQLDYNPRTVLRRPIRPIVDPEVVTVSQAEVTDNELVIGVVVDGTARAYPINQLTGPQREIINDQIGHTPIAATW